MIKNGQLATDTNLNNAFVSRTNDSIIVSSLFLNKAGDGASTIKSAQDRFFELEQFKLVAGVNVQREVNPTSLDDETQGHKIGAVWRNSTNNKYFFCSDALEDNAVWLEIKTGGGGGGSSLTWEKLGVLSPMNESQDGIKLESFHNEEEQEIYLTVTVPADHAPNQILLTGGAFFTEAVIGNVLFQAITSLIRPGTTVAGTYANSHTSTNAQVVVSETANMISEIGNIDLTDINGAINGQTVQSGDILRVKLIRKISSETITANKSARVLINNFGIKFS